MEKFEEWYDVDLLINDMPLSSGKNAWDHQQEKIDKLAEALRFYSNKENWCSLELAEFDPEFAEIFGKEDCIIINHIDDYELVDTDYIGGGHYMSGKLARQTLKELGLES